MTDQRPQPQPLRQPLRQLLLEGLMQEVCEEEKNRKDAHFLFYLAKTALSYLQQRRENRPRHNMQKQENEEFFFVLMGRIREFSHSQKEEDALVAELAEKVVGLTLGYFHFKFQQGT